MSTQENYSVTTDCNDFVSVEIFEGVIHEAPPARETVRYDLFVRQLMKGDTEKVMALHGAIGVCGEAGELADAIKREYIYGKPRDLTNIVEELGDIEWYLQAIRNHYGVSRTHILQANADKLTKRYVGLKYSDTAAIARADKALDK